MVQCLTELYTRLDKLSLERNAKIRIRQWVKKGKPVPVYREVKHQIILDYANQYHTKTFIETGTYEGRTLNALKYHFEQLYSIELSEQLFARARKKFKRYSHMTLLQGDSSRVLAELLPQINTPCLFWLDAHYSYGNTAKGDVSSPVLAELTHIFNHPIQNHVILIDDARDFGTGDYPTMEQVEALVRSKRPGFKFYLENDIIRIHP